MLYLYMDIHLSTSECFPYMAKPKHDASLKWKQTSPVYKEPKIFLVLQQDVYHPTDSKRTEAHVNQHPYIFFSFFFFDHSNPNFIEKLMIFFIFYFFWDT